VRQALCDAAIKIGKAVKYENAGTVEFLVDRETNQFFFIEVNPRIQVEHTVTEEVTGIDLVKSQILVAQGVPLADPEIGLPSQEAVKTNGFAVQCRVTTEDPTNNFLPDYGRIAHYRSASGLGIRLDAGSAFSGATVNPFYDSLLVKVTARGRRFIDACRRMERSLQEFRVRGVKTNIQFLIKLITNKTFQDGTVTTRFIDDTPELFALPRRRNRATRLLTYDSPDGGADAGMRFERSTTAGDAGQAETTGAEEVCGMDFGAEAAFDHGYDVSRCASVATGDAVSHARFAANCRRVCPAGEQAVFAGDVGRGDI
jgi:pyruvate carboxylase